jgi:hypothetical protein
LTRNAFANTEQRATLLGIGLYSEGNRPTQQKLCSAPTELLSLVAELTVRQVGFPFWSLRGSRL